MRGYTYRAQGYMPIYFLELGGVVFCPCGKAHHIRDSMIAGFVSSMIHVPLEDQIYMRAIATEAVRLTAEVLRVVRWN